MHFPPDNPIVKLCAKGMEFEGQGNPIQAQVMFEEAWITAANDFEKFVAAHYVARSQKSVNDKLKWDKLALFHALHIQESWVQIILPSLNLNIGKAYEDLNDLDNARLHYETANSFKRYLPNDGYGKMIKSGIELAMERVR